MRHVAGGLPEPDPLNTSCKARLTSHSKDDTNDRLALRPACPRRAGAAGIAAIGLFLPAGRAPGSMGPAAAVAALREAWDKVIPRADE